MSNGLMIMNNAGELVVSSDSRGTRCIGRTTFGHTVQPSGPGNNRNSGYSVHYFNWYGPLLWAFDMPTNRRVGIISSGYSNGQHTIAVYGGDNPDQFGFDTQYPLDVWAFAPGADYGSNYGCQLFNQAGELTHDLANPNISFPVAAGDIGSYVALPTGVIRPIGVGSSPFYYVRYTEVAENDPSVGYLKTDTRNFLKRSSGDIITYTEGTTYRGVVFGNRPPDSTVYVPSPFFISEGNRLP